MLEHAAGSGDGSGQEVLIIIQEEVVAAFLLLCVLDRVEFVDSWPEVVWVSSECDLQQRQEFVHACQQALWSVGYCVFGRDSVEDDDSVSEVRRHDEVVFDYECCFLSMKDVPLDDSSSHQSLFRVQVSRWFINEIHVCWFPQTQR